MDIYERLMEELEERNYIIHKGDENGYEYLKKEGYSIEVLNDSQNEEDHLFIEYDETKYALYLAGEFETYTPEFEEDVYVFLKDIKDILSGKKCSVKLFYNTDDFPKCRAGGFMKDKDVRGKDVDEIFRYVFLSKTLKDKLDVNGGRADFSYFDPSKNFVIDIEKKTKH